MKNVNNIKFRTNKMIKFLIKALIQIAFFLMVIGFCEYFFVALELSTETPKPVLYAEAFALYLLSKVSKVIVDAFRAYMKKKNPKDNDEDDVDKDSNDDSDNDEDLF